MDSINALELLLRVSAINAKKRHQDWIKASVLVGELLQKHPIIMLRMQEIGKLDCLLCSLENDLATKKSAELDMLLLANDFMLLLSRSWLSLSYELLRTIRQRFKSNSDLNNYWDEALQDVFSILERIRVSEFKGEIAKGSGLDHEVVTFVPGDESTTTEKYIHGQSILNSPYAYRPTDGSLVWHVYNPEIKQGEEFCRIDLSNRLLRELTGIK